MNKRERRKILNNLNRRKKTLIDSNIPPSEIKDFMGVYPSTKLSKLSDMELKNLYNSNKNRKTFVNKDKFGIGHIYDMEYKKRYEAFYNGNYDAPMSRTYKNSMRSNLMTKYDSLGDVKKARKQLSLDSKSRYADQIERLGDKKLAKKIRRMSISKFNTMRDKSMGLVDFDAVFYDSGKDNTNITDDESNKRSKVLGDVNRFYNEIYRR